MATAAKQLILRFPGVWFLALGFLIALVIHQAQPATAQDPKPNTQAEKPKKAPAANAQKKNPKKAQLLEAIPLRAETLALTKEGHHIDFPVAVQAEDGTTWIACLDHNGTEDRVLLASKKPDAQTIEVVTELSQPGVAHQPAIAIDGKGVIWTFWGQINEKSDTMEVLGRTYTEGTVGEIQKIAGTDAGSDSFAVAGTDSKGRVWVAWQTMRNGQADIYSRFVDTSGKWSQDIVVANSEHGEWEPRIAFDDEGQAWIAWDGPMENEFNLHLTPVSDTGPLKTFPIAPSNRYEARASIIRTADGKGFWIAGERGRVRWGLDMRGHGPEKGLNASKEILFGKFDLESQTFTEIPVGTAGKAGSPVNLPTVGIDGDGRPWIAYRYFDAKLWRMAITRYNPETQTWTARRRLENATFGQDRRSLFLGNGTNDLALCYPSDLRQTKTAQTAGVYVASLQTQLDLPEGKAEPTLRKLAETVAAVGGTTPERPLDDVHTWEHDGTKYFLAWGDLHRHTDVSNCRTGFDGCIAEHFRYAYDMAKLDFMGTTDHTDVGKIYDPYEWWHNQRMHDAFHSPGSFNTLYVYEREQKWPWGHRNIVFAQRGGPIVYIKRAYYRESPWQKEFPVRPGVDEIHPTELWDIMERYGKPVVAISHTGATRMGTDWAAYEEPIDTPLETTVEIFQGARVSYEGIGAPQPTVGLRGNEGYTANTDKETPPPPAPIEDFGSFNAGVYQNALKQGHHLGVFASSDHIAQHVSYGGVYCKTFTREGIIEAFKARRTIAATDKIYIDFTCNGEILGSSLTTSEKPRLWLKVDGTAPLKRVTIVRNEEDWKVIENLDNPTFETEVVDEEPNEGINRYYLRIEQQDGNMAWATPFWVTYSS